MSDRGAIIGGLVLFLGLVTLPVWYNLASGKTARGYDPGKVPKLELPAEEKSCVAPREYMRTSHMNLLISWRDEVVREKERTFVAFDGKKYTKSLTGTCLRCHANKADFCDRCHDYAGVKPVCWECHVDPKQALRAAR